MHFQPLFFILFIATVASKTCPPGTYLEFSDCVKCEAGTFNPFSGAPDGDVCRLCPMDTFQPEKGSVECIPCPPGTHAYRGYTQCYTCGPGTSISRRRQGCAKCERGYFSTGESNVMCEECPDGLSSPKGADNVKKCVQCPPGRYGPSCSKCSDGRFKAGLEGVCEPCLSGFISKEGASKCRPCPAGTFSKLGSIERQFKYHCRACRPGTMSQKASDVCRKAGDPCPKRHFENKFGGCQTCKEGFFLNMEKEVCEKCPIGSVSRGGLQTECEICPGDQIPSDQNNVCRCPRGFYFDDDNKCVGCPLGYGDTYGNNMPRSFLGRKGCIPCDIGTFSNKVGQRCENCKFPLVALEQGSTSCHPCPPGTAPSFDSFDEAKYCVSIQNGCPLGMRNRHFWGAFCEPVACAANSTREDFGKTCTPCEPGEFLEKNKKGRPKCTKCPHDHFSDGGVTTKCQKCPSGSVRNDLNGSKCSCNGVAPGRFKTMGGRGLIDGVCKDCPRGSFSFSNLYFLSDDESCTPCRPGTFASKAGTMECDECPLNKFSNEKGAFKCKKCPLGTVGHPHFAATKCISQSK